MSSHGRTAKRQKGSLNRVANAVLLYVAVPLTLLPGTFKRGTHLCTCIIATAPRNETCFQPRGCATTWYPCSTCCFCWCCWFYRLQLESNVKNTVSKEFLICSPFPPSPTHAHQVWGPWLVGLVPRHTFLDEIHSRILLQVPTWSALESCSSYHWLER